MEAPVTWEALLVVLLAIVGSGVVLKGWTWWLRQRVVRAIPEADIVRQARGVSLRVLVQGGNVLPGMNPSKANRTTGDLVLTADRFLLASGRGVLADLRPERGRRFTSVRSTGPGRLVIEGDRPGPQGQPGSFRVELMLADAAAWVEALQPFVVEGATPFAPNAFLGAEGTSLGSGGSTSPLARPPRGTRPSLPRDEGQGGEPS